MKVLFFTNRIHNISLLIDEAISLHKEGHEVYFVYNNCTTKICECNMNQNSYLCEVCHRKLPKTINILPKSIRKIDIKEFWDEAKEFHFEYENVQDIKRIEYKNVKVGYAVMSAYISHSRNCSPLINEESRKYFDLLISTSCHITDALERAINQIVPDRICIGNARFFDSRPAFDLAKAKGFDVVSIDRMNGYDGKSYKDIFVNHTPHDIVGLQNKCDCLWDNASIPTKEKVAIGKSFFEKRRAGLRTNDKVYVSGQQKGRMPQNWDNSKRNIVIFNSSEDEYAAVGKDYEQLSLFDTQYQGIKYIVEALKNVPDVHVYLRIHPNLANVPYRYHTELMKLSNGNKNITVIPATDAISTYDLMEAAEKIVVFGSTMGLESAYWGKPVILLGGAVYYNSDLCYVPKTKEELGNLLTKPLFAKNNYEAIKWGFYMVYRETIDAPRAIDIDSDWFKIWKYRIENVHYLKVFGSSKLYAIYLYFVTRKYRKNYTVIDMPKAEDNNAEL